MAITVATLFYTVIPLYKTAALEEQIARREAELTTAERKLAALDQALKSANSKAYVRTRSDFLNEFVQRVSVACTTWRQVLPRGAEKVAAERQPPLAIGMVDCFAKADASAQGKSALSDADRKLFDERMRQLAVKLEDQRIEAQALLRAVPAKSDEEVEAIGARGNFGPLFGFWDNLADRYPQYKGRANAARRDQLVHRAELVVVSEFEGSVSRAVMDQARLPWPEPQ